MLFTYSRYGAISSMPNDNTSNNDNDAVVATFNRATRVDLVVQALARQGSAAVGDQVGNTRSTSTVESLQLNTATGRVENEYGIGHSVEDIDEDGIDWSQIDIPDDGRSIPAARARLQREVFELEQKANAIESYDQRTGKPVYKLPERDRDRMLRFVEGKKAEVAEAMKELDRLQAQRDRREALGQAWDVAEAEREARIENMKQEELERLEAQQLAREIFNRSKQGRY